MPLQTSQDLSEELNREVVVAECSIIIVTFNGLHDSTIPCLESIFRSTGNEDYEIVVVDNNSSDGTPAYLKELAKRESRVKLVLNASNRGFAGGNNDGIRAASGNCFILLNNDIQVTDGWLTKLRESLQNDHSIGLIGPVSNSVGNEQKIYTEGTSPAEIIEEGLAWARQSCGDSFETERLGFFCVAFRRDILNDVGLLDEAYDLGFYEDDDYCIRVRQAGFVLTCREDVFIYHRGSASFDKAPSRTRELLKKNRRLLERKFNIRYSPRHPRERQLDLVASYVQSDVTARDKKALHFRINNRLQAINELMPRGMFKRWRFKRRLSTVLSGLGSDSSQET
jgi:GT2 family glycosyltransferase